MKDCRKLTKLRDCSHPSLRIYRTVDGTCNSVRWRNRLGAASNPLKRYLPAAYYDPFGMDTPKGFPTLANTSSLPTPHEVADTIFKSSGSDHGNNKMVSALHMSFGQFLDHDITSSPKSDKCPKNPTCTTGNLTDFRYPCFPTLISSKKDKGCYKFTRSQAICQNGKVRKTRQIVNELSSYIDLSQVYSNDVKKQRQIRTNNGDGTLKITSKGLLPFDRASTNDRSKGCHTRGACFLGGDERVDEHVGLASFHTLFVREHNGIARKLKQINRHWDGEKIFQETKKILGGIFQRIVYNEYLPTLVDLKPYLRYDPTVDPRIASGFSAAAFRFGHSQAKSFWLQLDRNFDESHPPIPLQESFFNNKVLYYRGIEPTFFGLLGNASEEIDTKFSAALKGKLFIPIWDIHGFSDLTAINIQRARDHGVPDYNKWRQFCGLPRPKNFRDIPEFPPKIRAKFRQLYGNIDDIDLYPAGLSERPQPKKLLGPTFSCIVRRQFEDLRDGDRFFYENEGVFTRPQLKEIKKMTMARLLCNNLNGIVSIQQNVFSAFTSNGKKRKTKRILCRTIKGMNFKAWKENPVAIITG